MNPISLDQLDLKKFAQTRGTKFRLLDAARHLGLELVEATPYASAARTSETVHQESFSLVFHGPEQPLLPQGVYRFEHDEIGQFDLFLVPVGRIPGAIQYQVIFNRIRRLT